MKNLVFYQKDNSFCTDHMTGQRIPNPVPRHLRRRRQTIVAVIVGDKMCFGRAECQHNDVFSKSEGQKYATNKAIEKPILSVDVPENPGKLINVFIKHAKALLLPEKRYEEYGFCTMRYKTIKVKKAKVSVIEEVKVGLHAV